MARILVAEDEPRMAELVADALRADGHLVDVQHTGDCALATALSMPFDVIVLDVMLPVLDGFAICRRLRESRGRSAVLMLTARDAVEDRVNGLDSGADDYLVKPFAVAELRARVRALARRPPGYRGPLLQAGDLTLDPIRHEVKRGGRRIDLTGREFMLLHELMRHVNEPRSRVQLLDAVWGEDSEPYGNVVDLYIHYLRTKTECHGPRMIETVRGVGYVIRDA
jgi:DNA-binding response OmpR family regulator